MAGTGYYISAWRNDIQWYSCMTRGYTIIWHYDERTVNDTVWLHDERLFNDMTAWREDIQWYDCMTKDFNDMTASTQHLAKYISINGTYQTNTFKRPHTPNNRRQFYLPASIVHFPSFLSSVECGPQLARPVQSVRASTVVVWLRFRS